MILTIYVALWIRWRRDLNQKIQDNAPTSLTRNDQVVTAIMAARDNALEDTVLQFHWQLQLATQCFGVSGDTSGQRGDLLKRLLETAAEGAVIVYQWAERNPSA